MNRYRDTLALLGFCTLVGSATVFVARPLMAFQVCAKEDPNNPGHPKEKSKLFLKTSCNYARHEVSVGLEVTGAVGVDAVVKVSGANLQVVNGNGVTGSPVGTVNGLGNVIIGYNENVTSPDRSGSHNLVIGPEHSYSSYGGLVAGRQNAISGPHASVSGGWGNAASGSLASVSGGSSNSASGEAATVTGGYGNIASGSWSSVSGGNANTASGVNTSVSGGGSNTASGGSASVSGGSSNTASGGSASVSGGLKNSAAGAYTTVSGGQCNVSGPGTPLACTAVTTLDYAASVSGGQNNHASAYSAAINGGSFNIADEGAATVSGGAFNTASGIAATVGGGQNRSAASDYDWVAGTYFADQ